MGCRSQQARIFSLSPELIPSLDQEFRAGGGAGQKGIHGSILSWPGPSVEVTGNFSAGTNILPFFCSREGYLVFSVRSVT